MKRNSIAKRAGALVLCAALTAGSLAVAAGAAQSSSVTAQLSPNISIVVDGTERTFYNVSGQEVHPITYNGTTYLPIRSIGELMGKNVNWDQSTLTVSLTSPRTADAASGTPDGSASGRQIAAELHPEYTITVDGTARTFSNANGKAVYPLLYNGSIYLPIRAIGQLMGKTVSWNGTSSTVTLTGGSDVTDADSFNQSGTGSTTASITAERAKEIALNHVGLTASQVTFARADLDRDDGRLVYDVEFYTSDYKEYDYEIDASTGAVLSYDYDAEYYNGGTGSTTASITAERAREIALNHAGLTASQVTFARADLDRDDGRLVYDVEFYTSDYKEYDYEIDASTGAVLSYDYDAEHYSRPSNGGSTSTGAAISEARAREIALAQVSGAADSNIRKVELDRDDGRLQYEVKIVYNNMEYDFDIDASTGTILSRDVESVWD